jgi:hypothetical protein
MENLRNNKSGSVFAQRAETLLNQMLGISIDGARSFVKEHDLWLLQHSTSNGNPLLLAS